jgi:hypothetical protein
MKMAAAAAKNKHGRKWRWRHGIMAAMAASKK